jgi:hypothetical protein
LYNQFSALAARYEGFIARWERGFPVPIVIEAAECPICPEVSDDGAAVIEELQKLADQVASLDDPASRALLWIITPLLLVVVAYLAVFRILHILKKRRKLFVSILAFIFHFISCLYVMFNGFLLFVFLGSLQSPEDDLAAGQEGAGQLGDRAGQPGDWAGQPADRAGQHTGLADPWSCS